jgi:hypothetical protein
LNTYSALGVANKLTIWPLLYELLPGVTVPPTDGFTDMVSLCWTTISASFEQEINIIKDNNRNIFMLFMIMDYNFFDDFTPLAY